MRTPALCLALTFASACGAAPPRWIEGDRTTWSIPLADPEQPGLVVEATVHGKGPYRFLLDPDSMFSVIDDGVARELNLYSSQRYIRVVNQLDTSLPRKGYEVLALKAGELEVNNITMLNAPAGSLNAEGRPVHGILGSDLLSRTIVIHVDRDQRVVRLALTGEQIIPQGAVAVRGRLHNGALYVPAHFEGDGDVILQVRLASSVSTLMSDALAKAPGPRLDAAAVLVDETGTRAALEGGVVVPTVQLDGISATNVEFFRYGDRRFDRHRDYTFDGVLGANVLSRYEIVVDRDQQILWLAPRKQQLTASN